MHGASLLGEVLGNYRLTQELSTGGMGTVYRGEHELLGRAAAIKLLRPELCSNDVLVQRFFNEAKAATAIRHPGIIEVYDFGYTEDGRAYLVMEFLDGEPLRTRIERRGRLTELEAIHIARGIASALKAAHAMGIVHRDLKPDNIFLVPDPDGEGRGDRVKVLDFGVAKLADPSPNGVRHTQTGVLMGTPLYMAPEQARAAGTIDHRADLYSLGCILYELLVGKPPFLADGAGEIIALQLFGQADRPSTRAPGISPEIDALVMRLLEKEPRDRFQTAAEVQQALAASGAVLSQRPSAELGAGESRPIIPPTPYAGPESALRIGLDGGRPDQPAKKSALPIIAGVVTVVIAAAATFFVISRSHDDTEPPAKTALPAPSPSPAPAPAPAPAPSPKPAPAAVVAPAPTPAPTPAEPPSPAPTPVPEKRVAAKRPKVTKPVTVTSPAGGEPVVKPDSGPAAPATGPTTHTGMHTTEGAPIEPDLGEPTKKTTP